jgi:hypothetical protein
MAIVVQIFILCFEYSSFIYPWYVTIKDQVFVAFNVSTMCETKSNCFINIEASKLIRKKVCKNLSFIIWRILMVITSKFHVEPYHQLDVMKPIWQLKTNKFMIILLKYLFENDKWHVKGDDPFVSTTIHIVIFLVIKGSHYNLNDALEVMV